MFVETQRGMLIALRTITRVSPTSKERPHTRTIYFGDHDHDDVYDAEFNVALKQAAPIIPALPGTYIVHWGIDSQNGEEWLAKLPVVAWRINEYGCAHPVTVDTEDDDTTILFPDGIVVVAGDCRFDDIEAYKKYRREEHTKKKATA